MIGVDLMGFREKGTRISLEANDVPGILEDIGGIFNKYNMNITHIADFKTGENTAEVIIRTNSMNTDIIEAELEARGYLINSIMKNIG